MHELGVTFHIMDHLEKVAEENKVTHIRKVTLELGEVSTVIESYLQNCWTWAAQKRPLFNESEHTYLLQGNEFNIKEIEVE